MKQNVSHIMNIYLIELRSCVQTSLPLVCNSYVKDCPINAYCSVIRATLHGMIPGQPTVDETFEEHVRFSLMPSSVIYLFAEKKFD